MKLNHVGDIRSTLPIKHMSERKVFVRDLVLEAHIGAYEHEQGATQPIILNIEVDVIEPVEPASDNLEDVFCYNKMTQAIKRILAHGHIRLLETIAEHIAEMILLHPLTTAALIKIEKPRAIENACAAGVILKRTK